MAAATADVENNRTRDRALLAGWDRQQAFEEFLEASATLQRNYLEWITRAVRVIMPPMQNGGDR
jgi:hypothetical protein